jgi:hypothetical protein
MKLSFVGFVIAVYLRSIFLLVTAVWYEAMSVMGIRA